ncbi:unnamed protein product [Parnassius mnemosyne]|uniref:Carboxylic ester hydrolase n=1 Tax=Parnassius mnemosyne TaxID=213953 RepID=A0AAV1KEW5_9NEOP
MKEDCLFLNIYVPAHMTQKELPVFIFIHGGVFHLLSGNSDLLYGPQMFLQHGLIFITMNYRLGALGFLSLDIEEASGNAALKDVILALKWINDNIEIFGGDRNKVTIGGHSSGATIAHYLLFTEQTSNLFQRAILISGNAVCHRSIARHAKDNALTFAKQLGLSSNDPHELLIRLKEMDVFNILDAEANLTKYDNVILRPFTMFVPNIEIESPHALITTDPTKLLQLGLKQNIPILAGFNEKEGAYVIPKIERSHDELERLRENMEYAIPSDIEYPLGSEISKDLAKAISQYYSINDSSNFTLNNLVDLSSDSQYIYSIDSWIKSDPTPKNFAGKFKWPEYGKNGSLLIINENPSEGTLSSPLLERINFWYDVYDKYYHYVENGGKLEKKCIP